MISEKGRHLPIEEWSDDHVAAATQAVEMAIEQPDVTHLLSSSVVGDSIRFRLITTGIPNDRFVFDLFKTTETLIDLKERNRLLISCNGGAREKTDEMMSVVLFDRKQYEESLREVEL